jgi:DNA-binding SARP family transcriptional activator
VITLSDGWITLAPTLCWVDAWAFEQGLSEPLDVAGLQSILQLYGGMLLSDADHPLVYEVRERLRRKFVQGVLHLGQAYERGGEISSAISLYENALDTDCTPEDVHRALMRCFAREGKPAAVGAAYQRCRTTLWRHFATSPSSATEQIYRAVLNPPAGPVVARAASTSRPMSGARRGSAALRQTVAHDSSVGDGVGHAVGGISAMRHKMQG